MNPCISMRSKEVHYLVNLSQYIAFFILIGLFNHEMLFQILRTVVQFPLISYHYGEKKICGKYNLK